jgi:transposase
MAHPRAKLTVHGRRLLVERVCEQGWPVVRAAEAQGVSAATAYKWLGRWWTEGLAGLADRSSRPTTSPRRLPVAREQAILAYRAAHRVGPHRIGWFATRCRGWPSWTAPPGRWCATSVSSPASSSTWTSRSRAGSPTVAATASTAGGAGGVGGQTGPRR